MLEYLRIFFPIFFALKNITSYTFAASACFLKLSKALNASIITDLDTFKNLKIDLILIAFVNGLTLQKMIYAGASSL